MALKGPDTTHSFLGCLTALYDYEPIVWWFKKAERYRVLLAYTHSYTQTQWDFDLVLRVSNFGAVTILTVLMLITNFSFKMFYNLEFRSSAIEPHLEKLPQRLAQVDLKESLVFQIDGIFLNELDNRRQQQKQLEMWRKKGTHHTTMEQRRDAILNMLLGNNISS